MLASSLMTPPSPILLPPPTARACPPRAWWAIAAITAVMAGCATHPITSSERDGAEAHPPADLEMVPDPIPKIEVVRPGGPNKPYDVGGRTFTPITDDRPFAERGLASWYGKKFHGHRTSSGEAYNMYAMTAAHRTLPIPSYARVRNPANGREVIVRVNDRGPFAANRIIDLSYTAALKLGVLNGVAPVEIERITAQDIHSGAAFNRSTSSTTTTLVATADASPPTLAQRRGLAPPTPPPAVAVATVTTTTVTTPLPPSPGASDAVALPPLASSSAPSDAPSTAPAVIPTTAPAPAPLAAPSPRDESAHAFTPAAVGFWVQLGAYRQREGALGFQQKVQEKEPWLAPLLAVYSDGNLHKLQAGPYPTRQDAKAAAERIRAALQLVPTIVEKR